MYETEEKKQRALLFCVLLGNEDATLSSLSGEELDSLVKTMGAEVISSTSINLKQINSATYIGSGKVQEIKQMVQATECDLVVFNLSLAPRMQRNLEKELGVCVIDREEVILQIFADRAQTKEATLQVELARLEYSRPRLTRLWTNLSRQRGGAYGNKGEGESQLELDQRMVEDRIVRVKKDLEKVKEQRDVQRQNRMKSPTPKAAIVGYTNSGKSSLFNLFSQAGILVEDKLFATLDPTTRSIKLPGGQELLLTDTVGFISNLPHHLVDSFKSTLEEAKYADFLIIICDASHPAMLACYQTTVQVLEELGCTDKPAIVFINKMDKVYDQFAVARLKSLYPVVISGSIKENQNIDELQKLISDTIHNLCPEKTYLIPETRYDLLSQMRREAQVLSIDYTGEGILVKAHVQQPLLKELLEPYAK
ncbi:MAG: GTPase HflX [Sphaerochaetaceae bacterium]